MALIDNPRKLTDFSKNIAPNEFTKKVVLVSFPRLAKKDLTMATTLLPLLVTEQNLNNDEKIALEKSLANNSFSDTITPQQSAWRDTFISTNNDTALVEKRIRLAIDDNNDADIADWLTKLSAKDQQKDEWQYWQAIILLKNNKTDAANAILNKLASRRGFYGMVSSQKLNRPYQINSQLGLDKTLLRNDPASYANLPVIKRITELRHLGRLAESNREWRYYLTNFATDYLDLARYVYLQDWGDLSIQATIVGKLWENWAERLPIMYTDLYTSALKNKAIPLSYALAISRQESALDTTAQSAVGASGLMQLMPATAKETAKKIALQGYYSSVQLLDPTMNIPLGTYYLNSVYTQNENNRILASAAYNAGPTRVKRWLAASNGKLDAIAFIESIPFTETRNYVKNVLVYDYIYQLILKNSPEGILTQNELNKQY